MFLYLDVAATQVDAEQSLGDREMVVVGDSDSMWPSVSMRYRLTIASDLGTPFTERVSILKDWVDGTRTPSRLR